MPKKRGRKIEQFGHQPGPGWARIKLEDFVSFINRLQPTGRRPREVLQMQRFSYSEMQVELRRLMLAWSRSGPNLRKFFSENPALFEQIRFGKTELCPSDSGFAYLDWIATNEDWPKPPKLEAIDLFVNFIANPDWDSLGGPCPRCGDYFVKKSARHKVYCSRLCGRGETARSAVRQHRERAQALKIRIADECITEWRNTGRKLDWKEWVATRTSQEYGITRNWLTRAVNQGSLKAPGAITE